jgi:hypothetical protein
MSVYSQPETYAWFSLSNLQETGLSR